MNFFAFGGQTDSPFVLSRALQFSYTKQFGFIFAGNSEKRKVCEQKRAIEQPAYQKRTPEYLFAWR